LGIISFAHELVPVTDFLVVNVHVFNMGCQILVFYPELEARDKILISDLPTHVKTQNTFWLP
jgi:hypothetical protein